MSLSLPASHSLILYPGDGIPVMFLRKVQLDEVILRWKKTTRALKKDEQDYGKYLTDLLAGRTDAELVHFTDPVEAAAFFCLIDLMKRVGIEKKIPGRPRHQYELPAMQS